MTESTLLKLLLPIALFVIMLGVGLSLTREDFIRVLDDRKAFAVGAIGQLGMLPILGLAIAYGFALPPTYAVGLLILTFAPGGATSNLITYLSRGDVALSVSLTAVVGLVTPLTIPLLTEAALKLFLGSSSAVHLPLGKVFVMLVAITVLPVAIGILCNVRWPRQAASLGRAARAMGTIMLLGYIAGFLLENRSNLPRYLADTSAAVLCLSFAALFIGYGFAKAMSLNARQAVTVGVEAGIQNAGVALLVTREILDDPRMSVVPVVYGILMLLPAGLFGLWAVRRVAGMDAR